ncbi:hypothetical protein B1209_22760 [Raoultella planticola]|jgi:hypothetical protein|uniref:Uncharacterized protein n=2 Tax=Raoultella TaxID=160674 RepID=A0A443VUE8_RAOPL|nr:hypothetical protein CA210_04770 [Raoultella ornithinolytica]ATM07194.1 hypothetical protein CRT62_22435 [Raoultella planticola]AXC31859.1 hypothetical protein DSD31_21465 [Raoultella sp. X13]PJR68007.1 hypothetical protein CWM52_02100 [Raoultella sp. T31]ATM15596.1 hypothetical protein CRN15_12415 [Raoultella planticola]
MPASPLFATLTHKFPPEGVYGAEEKLVKPARIPTKLKNPLFAADIRPDEIIINKRGKLTL